ncbi:amino acid adenylation domain-containing protein [Streptomyces sp. YKOK-I1]
MPMPSHSSASVPNPAHPARPLPLLAGQSGIWFSLELGTAEQQYSVGLYTDIRGPLHIPDFRTAARQAVAETEALRLRFTPGTDGSAPCQEIGAPDDDWTLPVVEAADEAAARAWMRTDLARTTDIARDPLFSFALITVSPDRHFFYQRAHHLVLDGHSGVLVLRRTAEIYTALREGRDPAEGTLPGLAELHTAEADYHASERYAADRAHWAERLTDLPEPATLSLGERGGRTADGDLVRAAGRIPQDTLDRLAATARLARTNWSTGLIAAIAAYLHRVTGQDDILLSLPVANRATAVAKQTPGMTANIVPVRVKADAGTTVRALIRRALDETRQTLRHQQYRYEEILRDLRDRRDAHGSGETGAPRTGRQFGPVVNILGFDLNVSFAGSPGIAHRLTSGPIEDVEFAAYLVPGEGGLQLQLAANPARYSEAELAGHLRRFTTFLDTFATDPEAEISGLSVMLPGEREQLLVEWNDTAVELTGPGTLHQLFEEQAAATPDACALVFGEEQVSYGELNALANQVAHGLTAQGVGPESVVAVALPRSTELVAALLGVLKTGAAYLPIDLGYPAERRQYMLDNSHAALQIDDTTLTGLTTGQPTHNPTITVDPDCPAYVIYTSGSTGRPKGVTIPHTGIVNRLHWMQHQYRLTPTDRILHKTPIGFDVSVWELFWPLLQGATMVIAEPDGHKDPTYLTRLITQQSITTAHFVPSMLQVFLGEAHTGTYDSLRRVICSGEALPPETRDTFFRTLPDVELHNLYGPTEASIDVTHTPCHPDTDITIGTPVWNTRVYVLDTNLNPVPIGTPGDLYLAGTQLARGYLNRPDLTATAFLPNPHGTPGERMYRTGDTAAWTPNGHLHYLGRTDDQIKIRGQRVELGEIQTTLASLPTIAQAAVHIHNDRLTAYYVTTPDTPTPDFTTLRHHLPDHMIPTTYIKLDTLPLTPNGKLDRRALPTPAVSQRSGTLRAARNPREEILCGLFAEVLGVDAPLGIDDDFFALGGHSLLATRLTSRIRTTLGTELPLRTLFEAPTVAQLTHHLTHHHDEHRPPLTPHHPRPDHTPLSHAQRRLWFLDKMDHGSPTYHMPLAVHLHGPLDTTALHTALTDVVQRHDTLHTLFEEHDGEPTQKVLHGPSAQPVLEQVNASGAELPALLKSAATQPFDLAAEPPLRTTLFKLAEDEHVLLVVLHHIAGDGWSFAPLARDLSTAYRARTEGAAPDWQPLPVQYTDYTLWQHRLLGDERRPDSQAARQIRFWTEQLADLPDEMALPYDRSRPRQPSNRGHSVAWRLTASTRNDLEQLARESGASLFMVVQAALAALLTRLGAGHDIPIGAPIAGRTDEALDDLVGFFVNTLVLRTDTTGDPTFRTLLHRTRETDLHAYAHQDIPFERLVEKLNPARSAGRHPLFQVMLNFEDDLAASAFGLPGLEVSTETVTVDAAKFDLMFNVVTAATGELHGTVAFATDLFDEATVQGMAERFVRLLEGIAADPNRRTAEYELLSSEERHQLLVEWNDTAVELTGPGTLHQLFEEQAAATPDACALAFREEQVSYGELNTLANQVAHGLTAQGVGPESVAAVALPRSTELVAALLGVLKAGAAYLPIDLGYPAERRQYMLDNSHAALQIDDTTLTGLTTGQPTHNPTITVDPDCPAYVIYTSGSTGRPKGVTIPHRGVVNRLHWMQHQYRLTPTDRILHKTPIGFDVSVWELFWPLLQGATMVIAEPEGHKDPTYLTRLIDHEHITTAHFVPSMLQVFLTDTGTGTCGSLRRVICSGEALPPETRDTFFRTLPHTELHNLYGPTEASIDVTHTPCHPHTDITIGTPVWNTRLYVLDTNLNPVPIGTPGDLYLAGTQLARGYLNRPDLTAQQFIPCPFGIPGERMYRTGDIAAWTPNGHLHYLGRTDDQIKIRGQRVELGEIEAALLSCRGIAQAAVVVREDTPGDQRLTAYVVPASEATEIEGAALREAVRRLLPEHMVPSAVVTLGALPLTANGKLDRRALPVPDVVAGGSGRGPSTVREEILCTVFAETLGVPQVGLDDDFFELGGHSLLAVSLVERLRERGVSIDVRTLFTTPTVAGLATATGRAQVTVPPNLIPADAQTITPDMLPLTTLNTRQVAAVVAQIPGGAPNIADIYPLAPLQEGILFHHLMTAGQNDVYVLPAVLRFDSPDRFDRFRTALQKVVDRHDILRTAIVWEGLEEPVQVVLRHADIPVTTIHPEQGDLAEELLAACPPVMDLRAAPLLHLHVTEPDEKRQVHAVLQVHHLVQDHTALSVVLDEVRSILDAREHELPTPLPFRDVVAQARLGTPQEEHQAYFTALLGDVTEPTAPYGILETHGNASHITEATLPLNTTLSRRLREQAHHHGVSPATLFHVIWSRVTAATSGRHDTVFGTVLFGRMNAGTGADRIPGLFINTLPVRTRDTSPTLTQAITTMRDQLANLLTHEHAPLSLAQQHSGITAPTPLFTSLLNYRHSSNLSESGTVEALEGIEVLLAHERTNYPITISIDDTGDAFAITAQTATPIDPHAMCERVSVTAERLVAALESESGTLLQDLDVLNEAERRRVLVEWNDTAVELTGPGTLHQLFEEQATATPDACALAFREEQVSYGELNTLANQIAHGLTAHGVGPESIVAVALPRSTELVAALLGVLKTGAAYLPIDLGYPAERRQYMLDNSHAALQIDDTTLTGLTTGQPTHNPTITVDPDCPAYVIYTSGSTGRPKGVTIPHRGVVNRLHWMQHQYRLTPTDRILHKTPIGFDVSVWELFWPLLQGATMVIAEPDGHKDPTYLTRLITQQSITTAHFVPSMLQVFLGEAHTDTCGSLRRVICSGEALPPETRDTFFRTLPHTELHNLYGPTEASIDVTHTPCHPDTDITIGTPVWNTRLYVLDTNLNPVPIGTPGDLYLAGTQLARGYLNRPDLTAQQFIPNPHGTPGERIYRTGDTAAWTPNGHLHYLGRTDDQIKIRGQRVELGEIQTTLASLPTITQAAVHIHNDRLTAYYVTTPDTPIPDFTTPDFTTLRHHLPDHMIPTTYIKLDALPLTPNGKLDRRALPVPEVAVGSSSRRPRTAQEEVLCALFAEVLGIGTPVGLDDDFFALGGHSLLATRLTSRIRTTLGTELPLRTLFEAPTVAQLTHHLTHHHDEHRPPLTPHHPRPDHTPLSHAQRRLWFLDKMDHGSPTYHMPLAVHLHGPLDTTALHTALTDVVQRHDTLHTLFEEHDGEPTQKVVSTEEAGIGMRERSVAAADLHELLVDAVSRTSFDLGRQLPFMATLFKLAEDDHVLLLVLHHIAGDGWSFAPLARDLSTAYRARAAGAAPDWQPLPVQYTDYTLWQHRLLGDERRPDSQAARQLGYWQAQLAGLPGELVLPADRPRPAVAGHRGGFSYWDVDAELLGRLQALARESGASLFMVVQAALAALLTRLGAGHDIPIGAPIAGRTDEALDDLVGFFVNTLVLRTDTTGDPTFRTLLHRTRETDLHAYAHQDIPFERLVEVLNPERSLSRHPLFQVALNFQNNTEAVLDLAGGITVSEIELGTGQAKFDLSFTVRDAADGGLRGAIEYATDLFDQDTVDLLGRRLVRFLEAVVERPDEPLSRHELLTPEEHHQLLEEWNGTPAGTAPGTVHGLFAAQAAATPDRVALVHGDEQLTYAELNARANRLAHRLIADGAGTGTVVAVSLPRSVELVVALLGVLKSGAAYLPVDPDYPAERIAFMLADVESVAVLDGPEAVREPGEWPATDPDAAADLADLARMPAYVIYTSGSTGRPKGVVVRHDAVVNYLAYLRELTGFGAGDTVLNLASVSFDPSVRDVFGPLTSGARLVMARPEEAKDPAALLDLLTRHRVTVLPALVPTMLNALADAARDADAEPSPWLRMGLVSGEALTAAHVRRAAAIGRDWRLVNQYGPTESTMTATFHPVTEEDAREGTRLPIGRPIAGARCYVLDAWLRPVPAGSVGELYLAGDDLADGYVNRPGLTAERFVADPYGVRPGARMYRTGDLARWRADGTLEFHGRADDQVKLHGVRVELGEIQAVLAAVPGVAQAGVVVREDLPGRQLLTGYVVPEPGAEPTAETLRRALTERLPRPLVPGAFVVLDALPLSPNGKLDRKALPMPESAYGAGREPATPAEKALAELFGEVLGLDRVSAEDNFFGLGGHSLLAARLVSRVRAVLGVELHLRSLFQAPTVASLAALVERDGGDESSFDVVLPIRPQGSGTPLFCVHPVGGLSWCYARLVPYLGETTPVYGLQARGIVGEGRRPRTIEEMADDYVEQIRRVQPHGPYQLLGWSVGGNVAHAVAVRLRRLGEPVALVALLDSCPSDLMDRPTPSVERKRLYKVVAGFDVDPADIVEDDGDDSAYGHTRRKELALMKGMSREQVNAMWDTSVNASLILREYRPEPLDVGLVYFTALLERPEGSPDVTAWEPYSGGRIEEYGIESSHADMMEAAPVAAIGRILGGVLRRIAGAR